MSGGERWNSPYINHFLSADTIVPGYANPQNLNRYSYVTNNPLRYTDPTGHWIVGDENPGCSVCTPSPPPNSGDPGNGGDDVDEQPNPPSDTHMNNEVNTPLSPLIDVLDSYNYFVGSNNLPLYQYYSWFYDIEVTGQFGLVYSNNSPLTVSLDPSGLNIRNSYYQTNGGFSANFGTQPSLGYAQSVPHNIISSVSGINVNPITGGITTNLSLKLDGPVSYRQSITVRGTIKPMEAAVATVGGAVVLSKVIPGPIDDAGLAFGAYKLCQATNLCP